MAKRLLDENAAGEQAVESGDEPKMGIEAQHAAMLNDTQRQLAIQPKRTVRLPKRSDTKQAFATVQINGYNFNIVRGIEVEVPQSVYNILLDSGEI